VHVSREVEAWFTNALRLPCYLLAFVPDAQALDVPDYDVHSSLQDATPFHLTRERSLASGPRLRSAITWSQTACRARCVPTVRRVTGTGAARRGRQRSSAAAAASRVVSATRSRSLR